MYPGESISIKLDEEMEQRDVAVTPRNGADWLEAKIRRVTEDTVELFNESDRVVNLKKGDQVDLRAQQQHPAHPEDS